MNEKFNNIIDVFEEIKKNDGNIITNENTIFRLFDLRFQY